MRKFRLLLPLILPLICLGTTGCNKITAEENAINVKLLLGGYGSEWLEKAIEKFEATYAKEGYKIKLQTPNRMVDGNSVYNELLSGYKKKKIDLYFTGSLKPIRCIDNNQMLVEDITESVYEQKAIRFDGSEEEKTVREKLDPSFGKEWYEYDQKAYCFFYMKSIGSLVVNREKLEKFGFDLPVTSNQMIEQIQTITKQNKLGATKILPLVTVKNTGYATVMMNSWFTQYSGIDAWNGFWSMNNPDGTYNTESGYEVFNDPGLEKAAELMFETYDYNNFVTGSKDYDIPSAHASLMQEKTGGVFLFDGDWALNETASDFPLDSDLQKLSFINVPIISALGTKLWGTQITDPKVCDNVLAKVALLSDEGKEVSEIKAAIASEFSYDLSDESILEVCKARGVYNNRGVETGNAYLVKGIDDVHKDIASKFLRMLASDDFSKMYFSTSRCFSPYSTAIDADTNLLPFSKGHAQIATHKYASVIWPMTTGLRAQIGTLNNMYPLKTYFHQYALDSQDTAYTKTGDINPELVGIYKTNADAVRKTNYDYVVSNWNQWVEPYK